MWLGLLVIVLKELAMGYRLPGLGLTKYFGDAMNASQHFEGSLPARIRVKDRVDLFILQSKTQRGSLGILSYLMMRLVIHSEG